MMDNSPSQDLLLGGVGEKAESWSQHPSAKLAVGARPVFQLIPALLSHSLAGAAALREARCHGQ